MGTSPDTGQYGQFAGITDFVGRKSELSALASMLSGTRLVTIAGPGGVGKTRIARAAAAEAVALYPDGAWIVELSGLNDPELLPNTVAGVLQLPGHDTRSQLDTLLDHLRDRHMLLVLDTCEHMVDACAELTDDILHAAPGVTVLATSRQPLDTPGEHVYNVQPLPVPGAGRTPPPYGSRPPGEIAAAGDAIELFALRAASAVPGFRVTAANWADVNRLCRRLDGIPLAIELAAVRLREIPLPDLVRRLDQTFGVLTREELPARGRHETLRTAIEWSHRLCSPAEQRVWARLSVFAGTFDIRAAQEVCAETELERDDVLSALVGLVDKSVVLRDSADDGRYWLLDTLREFGAEQLAALGEVTACRDRHAGRYLRLARHFGAHFTDSDQLERYHELLREHANIRAALDHGLLAAGAGGARAADGADLATSLYGYWQISGMLREGGYWLTRVLDRFPSESPERARALVNRGFLRSFQGRIADALEDCRTGTGMALSLGEAAICARGYQHLNLTLAFNGMHAAAERAGEEARRRLAECGDRPGQVMLMAQMGHLQQLAGDPDAAIETCTRGLEMLGAGSAERWVRSYLHNVCGYALLRQAGREAECESVVTEALTEKQELGDLIGTAYSLETLGCVAARAGDWERTAWLFGTADPLWERGGTRFSGTAIMERMHQDAAREARTALGRERYAAIHTEGSRHAREQVAAARAGEKLAISDRAVGGRRR
ncbi:MAG: LuxR family transcriptional regulator [Streptosporangiales bacterium]|nr:LuxR family transcriptional regulator [Streptosporangiales bacterium]